MLMHLNCNPQEVLSRSQQVLAQERPQTAPKPTIFSGLDVLRGPHRC